MHLHVMGRNYKLWTQISILKSEISILWVQNSFFCLHFWVQIDILWAQLVICGHKIANCRYTFASRGYKFVNCG